MGKSRIYPLKPGVHTVPCGTEMHRICVSPKNRIRLLDHDVSPTHVLADLRMGQGEPGTGTWTCAHAVGFMVGLEELQDKLVLADTAYVTRLVGILRDEDDYLDDVRFTSPLPNKIGKEDREWPSRLGPAALRRLTQEPSHKRQVPQLTRPFVTLAPSSLQPQGSRRLVATSRLLRCFGTNHRDP